MNKASCYQSHPCTDITYFYCKQKDVKFASLLGEL